MSRRMLQKMKGFTMIELVMVIVIIGILAAAALPRFANLTSQAQTASNQGTAGALRAAIGVAHAAWIAAGSSGSASTVTLDSQAVSINGNGWPDGGAGTTSATPTACNTIFSTILASAPQSSTGTVTDTPAYVVTSPNSATCTYTMWSNGSSTGRTITYNISNGTVTAT